MLLIVDFLQLHIIRHNSAHFRFKWCSENSNKILTYIHILHAYSFRSSAISLSFRSISADAVL